MELAPHESYQTLSWIFDQHADSSGRVSVKRLSEIIDSYRSTLSERSITKLLNYADTNRDGYISKQEIIRLERQDAEEVARGAGVSKSELTMFRRGVRRVARMVLTDEHDQQIYYERYSCLPPPLFMILISIVQVALYIYYSSTYDNWWGFPYELLNNLMIFDPYRRQQVWRFFSYMFLHAGFEHCFFNVSVQLILGVPLEMVHGGLRVGAIYLAGVLGGSLSSSVFDPYTKLVGASGGVYSLFAAQLANVILNGDVMHKLSSLFRTIFVTLVLCADFGYAIYRRIVLEEQDQVSFVAHVAGAIAGLTMGLIVLVNFKKSLRDKVVVWIAVVVYIAFVLFAVFWNIFWPRE